MSYVRSVVVGLAAGALVAEASCRVLADAIRNADRVGRNAIGSDRVCTYMNENCRLIAYPVALLVGGVASGVFAYVWHRLHPDKSEKKV